MPGIAHQGDDAHPGARGMPGWFPAAEKAIGTILAMPMPQNAKAAIASHGQGDSPATSMPAAAIKARHAQGGHRAETVADTRRPESA